LLWQLLKILEDIDPTFDDQILDMPQRQEKPHIEHHYHPDDLS